MNCSNCGFEIQSSFAFCPKCGTRQPTICAGCGYLCAPDFAFCPKCGAAVGEAVKGGASNGDKQRSPPGSPSVPPQTSVASPAEKVPISRSAPGKPDAHADRRPVTVLFADLSGFTTLSERLDPEVMRSLQNELFEEMTAAVHKFGGFVDKFIGDALLALFGAPAAHEDDPERPCVPPSI